VRPADEIVSDVEDFMELGASFNFYMFHGGTNFGFTNGANYAEKFDPTITSYDYNAPLNEAGDRTETYYRIRETIGKYATLPPLTAKDSEKAAYGKVELTESAPLFENLSNLAAPVHVAAPKFMEDIGQDFGYTLYRTAVSGPSDGWGLGIDKVHDRAQIFVDGEKKSTIERWDKESYNTGLGLPLAKNESVKLDVLCENMGRVNYGNKILDRKGIKGVRFGQQYHFDWDMYPLTMEDLSALSFKPCDKSDAPAFYRGYLNIDSAPCDTFLRLNGFTKGFVKVNGVNIGRYFNPAGPQKTLYVPAPFLKQGKNEIIVFESDGVTEPVIEFTDVHELG